MLTQEQIHQQNEVLESQKANIDLKLDRNKWLNLLKESMKSKL